MNYKSSMSGLEFSKFRNSKDLTQSEISYILGVSIITVKSWEHERRNVPKTVNNFLRLSIAQVPVDKLKLIAIQLKSSSK
jgi:DNA-binding transcriptional regulator YiaG